MKAESLAQGLVCIDCGAAHPLGYRLECERCRGLLELRYDIPRLAKTGPAILAGRGLWRYAPVLPIADPAHRVTLGEGETPLLECPHLAKELGVRRLLAKFEGPNPTGTVKDRSSATAVGAALQFGYAATSVVSSGNAGSSIAAYSARAGLRSLIFAYEIAEQTGFTVPDVVVAPVAVGETFIATARGFREMREAGWIAKAPLLVAAQAARANAVVRAFRDGGAIVPLKIGYTVAEGLAAGNPGKKGA